MSWPTHIKMREFDSESETDSEQWSGSDSDNINLELDTPRDWSPIPKKLPVNATTKAEVKQLNESAPGQDTLLGWKGLEETADEITVVKEVVQKKMSLTPRSYPSPRSLVSPKNAKKGIVTPKNPKNPDVKDK